MRRLATLLGFVVPIAVAAQSHTVDEAPVFRLSVELVQVDAVVTDGKGSHVTTLGSQDFEVFQDGEPRAITAVVYVDEDERSEPLGRPRVAEAIAARPRDRRRTIALVVDDLRMSFESLARARPGLSRFVDEHLRPEDLVSLVATSGNATPFTVGRAELRAAASRLRFSPFGRSASILDPISSGPFGLDSAFGQLEEFREQSFAVGALGRVEEVVQRRPHTARPQGRGPGIRRVRAFRARLRQHRSARRHAAAGRSGQPRRCRDLCRRRARSRLCVPDGGRQDRWTLRPPASPSVGRLDGRPSLPRRTGCVTSRAKPAGSRWSTRTIFPARSTGSPAICAATT